MKTDKKILIHLDVDSPAKLMDFYKVKNVTYSREKLESFYKTAWERTLDFFDRQNIKVSFFVVGNELENNETIQKIILQAHRAGHEIENHTYSHPFGLATLPSTQAREEIVKCSEIIEKITGTAPAGFRSPGYSISTAIINLLEELNFSYDSSGFWSVMNPLLKMSQHILFKNGVNNGDFGGVSSRLSHKPYIPHSENWINQSQSARKLYELPLPRTNIFSLPFYNNFNLWAPSFYTDFAARNLRRDYIVYLFHIIEFMDMSDFLPKEISVHPNIKMPVKTKMERSQKLLSALIKRYEPVSTRNFVNALANKH